MFTLAPLRRSARGCTDLNTVIAAFTEGREMTLALKDEPYPYAVTVNYAPLVRDNELYLIFHGARSGRKYELLRRCPQAAFAVTLRSVLHLTEDCRSSNYFKSLAGDGEVEFLSGAQALDALTILMHHHGSKAPADRLKVSMQPMLQAVQIWALKVRTAALKEHPLP